MVLCTRLIFSFPFWVSNLSRQFDQFGRRIIMTGSDIMLVEKDGYGSNLLHLCRGTDLGKTGSFKNMRSI